MATSYGTIPSAALKTTITYTADTGQGTSNYNTAGIVTIEYIALDADAASLVPALMTAWTGGASYLLTNAVQEQQGNGLTKVTLTYTATSTSTPPTNYSEQTSMEEVDIRLHPDFASFDGWDDDAQAFAPGSSKYGVTSYVRGSTTVTKTVYSTSKPSHQMATVGQLDEPGGDYTESNHYLIIGANRILQGTFWLIVTTYKYSPDEYDTDIYSHV